MTTSPDAASTPPAKTCDTCGGAVAFDPATQHLRCRQCKAVMPLDTGRGAAPGDDDGGASSVARHPYPDVGSDAPATLEDVERVVLECRACGATSELAPNTLAGACPYCKATFVGNPTSTRTLQPQAVLPLTVSRDDASAAITHWLGNRWFAPRALKSGTALSSLAPVYSPSWVFDLTVTADYDGRRGDNYMVPVSHTTTDASGNSRTSTTMETRIRWRRVSGTVQDRFDDLVIPSGNDAVAREADDLRPWGVHDAEPYADDYLRGTTATTFEVNPAAGRDLAVTSTDEAVRALVEEDIGGDHQDVDEIRRQVSDVTFLYLLLPVWIAAYRFGGTPFEVVVNGRTGAVAGTRPISWAKVAAAIVIGLVVVAAIVAYLLSRRTG